MRSAMLHAAYIATSTRDIASMLLAHNGTIIPREAILVTYEATMTCAVTARSRNDVVRISRTHSKPHSHSNNCRNYNLYTNLPHEQTFEGRTYCFVRIHVCCQSRRNARAELRDNKWKWGSRNVTALTGKVDKVVHDGKALVQSNKVRIPVLCPFRSC